MKIDGLDWMDWLHKKRAEAQEDRKRSGQSLADWLKQTEDRAREIRKEIDAMAPPVARDK
jgi:hypothetical protein